eukprot:scaffold10095_cov163-Amphora_coffeaeformis.AAC.5
MAFDRLVRHHQDSARDEDGDSKQRRRKSRILNHLWRRWRSASLPQKVLGITTLVIGIWFLYKVFRRVRAYLRGNVPPPKQTIDFLVAGFPKCGTTSILFALEKHPQVIMDDKEYCHIARPLQQDDVNMNRLNRFLTDLITAKTKTAPNLAATTSSSSFKLGIKCPEALKNFKAIHRLSQHSPYSKWVVGLRHPILFVQSFYNYRVMEFHLGPKHGEEIPNLHQLWENRSMVWRDLSSESSRFDLQLMQLGKTSLNVTQLQGFWDRDMLAVKPNHFPIFLYTIDQIDDTNLSRKRAFQNDLLQFLDLDTSLLPEEIGHANKNRATGKAGYAETINICSTAYADIRTTLLEHGAEAARWILDELLQSPDVHVSNAEHFRQSMQTWFRDPCHDGLDV